MAKDSDSPEPREERRKSGVADRRNPGNDRRSPDRVVTVTRGRRHGVEDRRKKPEE
jgi:hypothetical protein